MFPGENGSHARFIQRTIEPPPIHHIEMNTAKKETFKCFVNHDLSICDKPYVRYSESYIDFSVSSLRIASYSASCTCLNETSSEGLNRSDCMYASKL